jgi:predicted signal transduction protein with EAL and GGDEF domain
VACFDPTFRIDGRGLRVTTSVGVALHTGPEGRGDRLLRAADGAMYRAKQRGRNQICCADDEPLFCPTGPSLEQELVEAVTGNDLRLHFQPIVGSADGCRRSSGWRRCCAGSTPGSGCCRRAPSSRWPRRAAWSSSWTCGPSGPPARRSAAPSAPGVPPLQFSVNLAGRTLVDARLVQAVRSALADHSMDPARLCLEVVESQSLVDLPTVAARLTELRRMGVRTALDDFGTGYSTLSWLQRLPVDRIKLDRTFITGLPRPRSAARPRCRGARRPAGHRGRRGGRGDAGAADRPGGSRLRADAGLPAGATGAGAAELLPSVTAVASG